MIEADVTAACGPRQGRDVARHAGRWSRTSGGIGFQQQQDRARAGSGGGWPRRYDPELRIGGAGRLARL